MSFLSSFGGQAGGTGGLIGKLDKFFTGKSGDVAPDFLYATQLGKDTFAAGNALTDEGLGQLRSQYGVYSDRLNDPLGPQGRGIFTRGRGTLSDVATQRAGAFKGNLAQRAAESGGALSPAARAQLEEENQRGIDQGLFEGNVKLSDAEASLTMDEVSKLFDRMDKISSTIIGVGKDKNVQGLEALFKALGLREGKDEKVASVMTSFFAPLSGSFGGGGGGSPNPYG